MQVVISNCLMHLHQKINYQTPKSGADLSDCGEEHTRLVNESVLRLSHLHLRVSKKGKFAPFGE